MLTLYIQHILKIDKKMSVNTPAVHPRPPVCMYSTFFVLGLEKEYYK